jgi:hypothetical protein
MLNKLLVLTFIRTIILPPPTPYITRLAINIIIVVATTHVNNPRKNATRDIRKVGLRPKRLLSFPKVGIAAAIPRRYESQSMYS